MAEITQQTFERHVAVVGPRQAIKNLNFAAKLAKTKKAVTSEAGREILKNVESKIEALTFHVIMDDKATPEDKMELRAYVKIYIDWVERIHKFEEVATRIRNG
jgi:hypothetical protein